MPEVPVSTTPAVATTASTQAAPAQAQSVTHEPKTVTLTEAEYGRLNGAVQRANRIADELSDKIAKLQPVAPAQTPAPAQMPQGVEAELKELRAELERQRQVAAQEKLDAEIVRSATAQGVDPNRIKYLKMELREAHGQNLTHEGSPDPIDSTRRISVETLIGGILKSPAGAMFRAAPVAGNLPSANANSHPAPAKKTLKRADFDAIARKGGDTYKQTYAGVKAGEIVLVDD